MSKTATSGKGRKRQRSSVTAKRTRRTAANGGKGWAKLDAMSEAEKLDAARGDPDNPPLSAARLERMRPMAFAKRIRWALRLSQEEFAAAYAIPLEILKRWERFQAEPDAVALAYLRAIERNPEGVRSTAAE